MRGMNRCAEVMGLVRKKRQNIPAGQETSGKEVKR